MRARDRNKRNEYRKRYYKKTQLYKPRKWTKQEDELILAHELNDALLSKIVCHSVQAIQIRRWRLKQEIEDGTREAI